MKLSDWAKQQGIHYQTAYRWFKNGKMPVKAVQLPSGTIMVYDNEASNTDFIPIYIPHVAKNQRKYMLDCIDNNQITQGKYIRLFEEQLEQRLKVKHAIAVSNGSISLVLSLKALGIGFGDEVITQSLTYAATVSSINNVGAVAVLCDCDDRLQINIDQIEELITKKTKAIMVAQLYGDAPNMKRLVEICKKYNIHLIEDAAEASFCYQDDISIGSFGIVSSFSWFSNKTITTGEGGTICTNNDDLAARIKLLRNQSHLGSFIHDGPGYNARMTNIQAAYGLSQLEELEKIIYRKKEIAEFYRKHLSDKIARIIPQIDSAEWMSAYLLPDSIDFRTFANKLSQKNIDTRPVFMPIHLMKGFDIKVDVDLKKCEQLAKKGFNLPSYPDLSNRQLKYISDSVNKLI